MKEKWLVVFGPPAPEYNIEQDLGWSSKVAKEKKEYVRKYLKHHMFEAGIKYGYIVKDWIHRKHMVVFEHNAEEFWVKILKQGIDNSALGAKHIFEVRRMREIDGEYYCTDPYRLLYQDICSKWPKKGIKALDP